MQIEKVKQESLFSETKSVEAEWEKEWQDMPEFVQSETDKPYAQIIFRFANAEDLKQFSEIIGQKLTKKTKSAWHPQIERGKNANKIYVHES